MEDETKNEEDTKIPDKEEVSPLPATIAAENAQLKERLNELQKKYDALLITYDEQMKKAQETIAKLQRHMNARGKE